MAAGNALLVTTTSIAPDRVVKPLQQLLGDDASDSFRAALDALAVAATTRTA